MNKQDQLMAFLGRHQKYMTAKDVLDAGFTFEGQAKTSLKDVRNIMSKLQEVERLYDESTNEVRVIAKNALWRHILRRK